MGILACDICVCLCVQSLYNIAFQAMERRGPDVHVLLFSYAIFLAATQAGPYHLIMEYVSRAKAATAKVMGVDNVKTHPFKLADVGFFLQAVVHNPCMESWTNYALCRQLVFDDCTRAEECYVKVCGLITAILLWCLGDGKTVHVIYMRLTSILVMSRCRRCISMTVTLCLSRTSPSSFVTSRRSIMGLTRPTA